MVPSSWDLDIYLLTRAVFWCEWCCWHRLQEAGPSMRLVKIAGVLGEGMVPSSWDLDIYLLTHAVFWCEWCCWHRLKEAGPSMRLVKIAGVLGEGMVPSSWDLDSYLLTHAVFWSEWCCWHRLKEAGPSMWLVKQLLTCEGGLSWDCMYWHMPCLKGGSRAVAAAGDDCRGRALEKGWFCIMRIGHLFINMPCFGVM